MNLDSILREQIQGAIPVSISTSLALESLLKGRQQPYDLERKIPKLVKLSDYSDIWFNTQTLFRNLMGSLDKKHLKDLNPRILMELMWIEIEMINDVFKNEGGNVCIPRYYHSTYAYPKRMSSEVVRFRMDTTTNQKNYTALRDETLRLLYKRVDNYFKVFSDTVSPERRTKSLILTHMAYDLVSIKDFDRLDLIESHTGVLKSRQHWNTKYFKMSVSLEKMPFTRRLLKIFGDNSLIKPMSQALREQILEVGDKAKWTSLSAEQKITSDLNSNLKDRYFYAIYLGL